MSYYFRCQQSAQKRTWTKLGSGIGGHPTVVVRAGRTRVGVRPLSLNNSTFTRFEGVDLAGFFGSACFSLFGSDPDLDPDCTAVVDEEVGFGVDAEATSLLSNARDAARIAALFNGGMFSSASGSIVAFRFLTTRVAAAL